jgi:hypothetical protein
MAQRNSDDFGGDWTILPMASVSQDRRQEDDATMTDDDKMHAKTESLRQAIAADVAQQLETAQAHLDVRFDVLAEDMKDVVKSVADNFGGVLESIHRELREFREESRQASAFTKTVLSEHATKIAALESARDN